MTPQDAETIKLTKAQRDLLLLAVRSETGNPWPLVSMSRRGGGALSRMFDGMKARGWFDAANCITSTGRELVGAPQ